MHSSLKVNVDSHSMNSTKTSLSTGIWWLLITLLVIIVDRYIKFWMIHHLTYQEPFKVLPIFNLTLYFNTGTAFGFLHNQSGWQNLVLGGLNLIVSIAIIFWLAKVSTRAPWLTAALGLILGGAIGNLCDRVLYGHVIDFLSFHLDQRYFAIFNIADSAICVGAFILLCHSIFQRKKSSS